MTQRTRLCGFLSLPASWSAGGKQAWYWAGLKRSVLAVGLLGPISACAEIPTKAPDPATAEPVKTAPFYWPWSDGDAQQPPKAKPYRLPTLAGDNVAFQDEPAKPVKAPHIDEDAVYQYVLDCFPEVSKWNLDVSLRAQLARSGGALLGDDGSETELGSSYVGIVAKLPLYSASEISREKEREYKRRMDVAGNVANFITAIASRNHAVRELALYRSLEARSAIRVQQGIVEVAEQVQYLEKVAGAQESLIKNEAQIMENRLKLVGMCDPVNAPTINAWLTKVSAVPGRTKPVSKVSPEPQKKPTELQLTHGKSAS